MGVVGVGMGVEVEGGPGKWRLGGVSGGGGVYRGGSEGEDE